MRCSSVADFSIAGNLAGSLRGFGNSPLFDTFYSSGVIII